MTSFTFYFGAAILAIFMVEATSYVIGGGVNTDFGSVENQPNWLQSALSSARNYRRNHRQHKKPKKSRIAFPGLVHTETWTSFDSVRSPFLRNKRQAQCALPSDLPQMVMALNRDLDVPQFLGLTRQGTGYTPLPLDQPAKNDCPRPTGSWWPRQATNLKSTCPWVMEEKDLGEEYFPR
ncbi:unnamed protein product [Lymnaea stagnalis]|uniref:Uncharacterized protein n=1 Tax=Lymnaea stagnalis TaxID=6523 RepID=A0AAV2HRE6_LYMST